MNKKTVYISLSLLGILVFFEYMVEKDTRKKLKSQINNIGKKNVNAFSENNSEKLKKELLKVNSSEKIHLLYSFQNTFKQEGFYNILKKVKSYGLLRVSLDNNQIFNDSIKNMHWYPYFFRVCISILNETYIFSYKFHNKVEYFDFNSTYIYSISRDYNSKSVVIFLGLGGILFPFNKLINYFLDKGYNVIIPLYGPAQASLKYSLNYNENEYYEILYNYLKNNNILDFSIISWSLGGILYKGFHNYIKYREMKINNAYLFEPLICIRSCMDTFFSHIRKYNTTLKIMNSVTCRRYNSYNIIFSYFLHTIIGIGTAQSLGYFSNVETKETEIINYKRYLFVSSDDLILNYKLDKQYISNNYKEENVFYRKGYHGGWPNSSKLINILDKIL